MNTSLLLVIALSAGLAFCAQDYDQTFKTYHAMRKHLDELYEQEKFEEAAALLIWAREKFPYYILNNSINLALMYVRLGQYDNAITALQYAPDRGWWFEPSYFEHDIWTPIKEQTQFAEILRQSELLKQEAQRNAKPDLLIVTPKNFNPQKTYPLFIALHGGSENMQMFKDLWKSPLMLEEFIILYPQSSQVITTDGFWWHGDIELAKKEIADAYRKVLDEYQVDTNNVIIGGFSSGGVAALEVVLSNAIPICGFVVLCPDWPESITKEKVGSMNERGVRGTIITNELDERLPNHKKMIEIFKNEGLPHQFVITPDIDHTYPEDLDTKIDQAIDHIKRTSVLE